MPMLLIYVGSRAQKKSGVGCEVGGSSKAGRETARTRGEETGEGSFGSEGSGKEEERGCSKGIAATLKEANKGSKIN